MKMKEKKTEEVIEEVETPKISDELVEYLAFARYCKSQMCQFFNEIEDGNVIQTVKCSELERFGVDTSLPIGINVGFSKENMLERFEELKTVYICKKNEMKKVEIEEVKYHKDMVLLKIKGINDLNEAEQYKGLFLKIDRKDAKELPEGTYV